MPRVLGYNQRKERKGMSDLSGATSKVVEVLTKFSPEERLRIVKASLTLLGDDFIPSSGQNGDPGSDQNNSGAEGYEMSELHPQAQRWMNRNEVSQEQIEHFYHFDDGKALPIGLPGNATSNREKSINAYLATGLANYLASGDASFSDADARELCRQSGCYDQPNHSKVIKALGNRVTGSKSNGWKLTSPGLSAVAELVKAPKN